MALEIHSAADSWAGATEPGPRGCLSRWQQHRSEAHRQVLRGHAVVGVEGGDKAQMVQKKRQCGPLHIWQAAEESSGAFRTQGSPAWVSLGHGLQHHLVEGLGDERRWQLSKVILEDACGQRGPLWLRHPGF